MSLFSLHRSAQPARRVCFPFPPPPPLDMLIGAWPDRLAAELGAIWLVPPQSLFRSEITVWTAPHRAARAEAWPFGVEWSPSPAPGPTALGSALASLPLRQYEVLQSPRVCSHLAGLVVE